VQRRIGDRAVFLGDLELPLQIVADGRSATLLGEMSEAGSPFKDRLEDDYDPELVLE
jgi:hypothetical protein